MYLRILGHIKINTTAAFPYSSYSATHSSTVINPNSQKSRRKREFMWQVFSDRSSIYIYKSSEHDHLNLVSGMIDITTEELQARTFTIS